MSSSGSEDLLHQPGDDTPLLIPSHHSQQQEQEAPHQASRSDESSHQSRRDAVIGERKQDSSLLSPPPTTRRHTRKGLSTDSQSSPTTPSTAEFAPSSTPRLFLSSSGRQFVSSNPPLMHQYVVLMRHGERRDSLLSAPPEADPPLTEAGKRDVVNAAQRVKQQIGVKSSKQLMIMSSPFVRTMETAAELQRYDIGVDRPATIDNTLCEVFGPLRVKGCSTAPDVARKEAIGELPRWGESIQDATDRFVTSFLGNANRHRGEHIILVSHGDAISGVLSHFYPQRIVYSTEFLSFIVLKRVNSTSDKFVLHGSWGVEWLVEGEEQEEEPLSASLHRAQSEIPVAQLASQSTKLYTDDKRKTAAGGASYGSSSVDATDRPPAIHRASSSTIEGPIIVTTSGADNGSSNSSPRAAPGQNRFRTQMIYLLHVAVVLSQMPALRMWSSVRDACVYIVNVTLLELVSLGYGWQSVVDRLPFGYGSPRRRILIRLARYPLARTIWKLLSLFAFYVVTAIPVGWIAGDTAGSVMRSFAVNAWQVLLLVLYLLLDLWRGYLDNSAQEEDPHRESI